MNWDVIYLVCFGTGLVLSVLSAVGGFGHLHLGHFHLGHSAGLHHGHGVSRFNAFTVLAFLCWFGGAGYLLHHYSVFIAPVVLLLAAGSGLVGAAILFTFFTKVLLPRERELTAEDTDVRGVTGRLSAGIRDGGTGELLYTQNGVRCSAIARSADGQPLPRGAEVIVLRYERGVAYVKPWHDLQLDRPD
ncbi:hypothetical protein AB4Y89_17855 [Terriglobus sp. 2YAB30_2]|uniref:hypothetical protein n=1 Tax=unclassified Terriglobus TaxID=2628988 RepID=UPI003F98A693